MVIMVMMKMLNFSMNFVNYVCFKKHLIGPDQKGFLLQAWKVGTLHNMKACGTSIIDWTSSTVPQQFFTNAGDMNAHGHICRAVKPVVPRQKLVSLSLICGAAVKARLLKTES